jgi:peptidoglycan/LPS O-acetylase OafA/YrhL
MRRTAVSRAVVAAPHESDEPATVRESPALQPPPGNPRFPLVDPLRAVAILLVVMYHAAATAGVSTTHVLPQIARQGFVGVMVFFGISGFLIYRPFVAAREAGRKATPLHRFWRRRALRILPAYWAALTALAAFGAVNDVLTRRGPAYYLFGQIYNARTFSNGIPVAWSLCVEMSFYLLLPAYAWLVARAGARWARAETVGIALLLAGGLLWRAVVHIGWVPGVWASALPGMVVFFAVGMGLAALSVRTVGREEHFAVTRFVRRFPDLCWAGALTAYVVAATVFSVQAYSAVARSWSSWYGNYILCVVGAALLLAPAIIGQDGGGISRRLLRNPVFAWIGLVSYGIFLWHLPLMIKFHERGVHSALALLALTIVVSTVVAAVSYYVLELPLLRLKEPRRQRSA